MGTPKEITAIDLAALKSVRDCIVDAQKISKSFESLNSGDTNLMIDLRVELKAALKFLRPLIVKQDGILDDGEETNEGRI